MDIQLVKISLTTEESAEALPIVMQVLAASPQSSIQGTDLEKQILAPVQSIVAGQLPDAFLPSPETSPDTQSEPPSVAIGIEEDNNPVEIPKTKISIAPPTGHPRRAKTMIYDPVQQRYRRRTLLDRLVQVRDKGDQWCEDHQTVVAIVVGSSLGLGLLVLCFLFNFPPALFDKFSVGPPTTIEEAEPTAPDSKHQPTDLDDSNNNPADASDKAGQPDKLPLSEGAIK